MADQTSPDNQRKGEVLMRCFARFAPGILCLVAAFGSACSTQTAKPATAEAGLLTPTKEIIVTDGDLNKPYDILGSIEYTLTGKSLYASGSPEATKQAKEMLRKAAFTKYGERVDAVINAKTTEGVSGGFWGIIAGSYGAGTGTVQGEGIAVSFKREAQTPPSAPAKSTAPMKRK
jgi:hypothetical protein